MIVQVEQTVQLGDIQCHIYLHASQVSLMTLIVLILTSVPHQCHVLQMNYALTQERVTHVTTALRLQLLILQLLNVNYALRGL